MRQLRSRWPVPDIEGVIERRLLVNYRVDPEVAQALLPAPFRPRIVDGRAVAGICLIRLGRQRPRGLPAAVGLASESAAHRFAVEWDDPSAPGGTASGVYVPRRDTASIVNTLVGGRLFPGLHQRARFTVDRTPERLRVAFSSVDGATTADVAVSPAPELEGSVLFDDLATASRFFAADAVAYSATSGGGCFDGVELQTDAWRIEPVRVVAARSSFFDDPDRFPAGTATLDCALLMQDVPVTWHPLARLSPPAGSGAGVDTVAAAE